MRKAIVNSNELHFARADQAHVSSSNGDFVPFHAKKRFDQALMQLLQATSDAKQFQRNRWDFAVEIDELRRLGVTTNDLRWLVCRGFVEHRDVVTQAGDSHRVFRPTAELEFGPTTCFVLSDVGVAELTDSDSPSLQPDAVQKRVTPFGKPKSPTVLPKWDFHRSELRFSGRLVKVFKLPCSHQETVLMAFEHEGWPSRIDDPLPDAPNQEPKRRLQDTICGLNRNQKECRIRFQDDGTGKGILWEPA